jgi:hypothetical protein
VAILVVAVGRPFIGWDAIAFLEPAAEVDIGTALRAEGLVSV